MPAMIPVPQNREPREGEKWFYEFHNFLKQFPEIHDKLVYRGFQFFDFGKSPLCIGGVFQIVGKPEISDTFLMEIEKFGSEKIGCILYRSKLEPYGENILITLLR